MRWLHFHSAALRAVSRYHIMVCCTEQRAILNYLNDVGDIQDVQDVQDAQEAVLQSMAFNVLNGTTHSMFSQHNNIIIL